MSPTPGIMMTIINFARSRLMALPFVLPLPKGRIHGLDCWCYGRPHGGGRDAPRGWRKRGPATKRRDSTTKPSSPNPQPRRTTNLTSPCPQTLPSSQQTGETALIYGAGKGHTQVVKMLLAAGANKDMQTSVGIPDPSPLPTHEPGGWRILKHPALAPFLPLNRTEPRP